MQFHQKEFWKNVFSNKAVFERMYSSTIHRRWCTIDVRPSMLNLWWSTIDVQGWMADREMEGRDRETERERERESKRKTKTANLNIETFISHGLPFGNESDDQHILAVRHAQAKDSSAIYFLGSHGTTHPTLQIPTLSHPASTRPPPFLGTTFPSPSQPPPDPLEFKKACQKGA